MKAITPKQIVVKRICCSIIGICESKNVTDFVYSFNNGAGVVEDLFDALGHLGISADLIEKGVSYIGWATRKHWEEWVNACINEASRRK